MGDVHHLITNGLLCSKRSTNLFISSYWTYFIFRAYYIVGTYFISKCKCSTYLVVCWCSCGPLFAQFYITKRGLTILCTSILPKISFIYMVSQNKLTCMAGSGVKVRRRYSNLKCGSFLVKSLTLYTLKLEKFGKRIVWEQEFHVGFWSTIYSPFKF